MKKYDKFLIIGLFILEAFYFVLIKQLPPKAARYPYFVLSLMLFLTIILAINTFIIKPKNTEDEKDEETFKGILYKQFFFVIIISAIYIILIDIIGFFVTTAIYLFVTMVTLKSSIKWSIVVSIIFPIFLYLIFVSFLKVPVPKGILI
ncbi:tripartite tricarboxylate transporter TctB family protein [Fusobacterium simiae]|uniref:tripartite tricarboxylate transporter TctB family protein n=1 Tax=Fusobacterium TaxID=848 RepID=UPI0004232890|nr:MULTISPECIES: tripartite tricarboxylate transporter TctB family protein [Fusobacterium]MDC7955551.1 tripartite tricarboxylate transporter TctB family protein [Fusobacterium simiae]